VLSEIERTADRIGMIRQGKLVFEGSIEDVMARHATLEDAFLSITGAVPSPSEPAH
jgi:ABC-type multidrug transport system ATPase subunit